MSNLTPLRFVDHTPATAPEAARPYLSGAQRAFGFVPSPLARMAESPAAVKGFSDLTALEREVLVLTVAVAHGCSYCVAMHSAQLARAGGDAALLDALRRGARPLDPRLAALAGFTRALIRGHGRPDDEAARAFAEAGFTPAQALEVVVGISTYTLSTFANRLTGAPLDEPFAPFRWEEPAA
jgi:AhpD family alkylhydroperoxidase